MSENTRETGKKTEKVVKRSGNRRVSSSAGVKRPYESASRNTERKHRSTAAKKVSSARRREVERERAMKVLKMRAIIAASAIAAVFIIYFVIAASYRNRFLPNTHVNGYDVGRMSVADTEDILKKSVENYRLELAFRGGLNELITSSDIGLTYVSSNEVQSLMENQNRIGWISSFFGKKNYYNVRTSFHFDSAVLRRYLESLPEFSESYITSPKNSTVVLDADNRFRVSTEFQGNRPNEDVIFEAVDEAVNSSATRLSLTSVPNAYETPDVTSDDQDLKDRAEWLNKYLDTNITLKYRDGSTLSIDRDLIATWATKDDNGLYTLDDDTVYMKIYKIVEDAAAKYDETYDTLDFESTNLGTVTLKCSTPYGYKLNVDSQTEKIFSKVYSHDTDEYECSICGTRYRRSSMVCPKCGVRFEGTMEDDTEFDEEMMEEEDWDEEEGMLNVA